MKIVAKSILSAVALVACANVAMASSSDIVEVKDPITNERAYQVSNADIVATEFLSLGGVDGGAWGADLIFFQHGKDHDATNLDHPTSNFDGNSAFCMLRKGNKSVIDVSRGFKLMSLNGMVSSTNMIVYKGTKDSLVSEIICVRLNKSNERHGPRLTEVLEIFGNKIQFQNR